MHVDFADPAGQPIAAIPLKSGQPIPGDRVLMERPDHSIVVFAVLSRQWHFAQNEDGGGVTARLVVVCAPVGSKDAPEDEEGGDNDE